MCFFRRKPSKHVFVDTGSLRLEYDLGPREQGQVVTEVGQNAHQFIFAFWQVKLNETIRIGLIRFCKKFWANKNRTRHHAT